MKSLFSSLFFLLFMPNISISQSTIQQNTVVEHPIVILISPPRSLSTAFLRMISARGDFACFHEYFTCVYAQKYESTIVDSWLREDSPLPKTFAATAEIIIEAAKTSPVFVKEMSLPMLDFLSQDSDFIKRKNVHLVFLIRNPHACTISYYNGLNQTIIERFTPWLGFEATEKAFKITQEKAFNKPTIIKAEDLYNQPEQTAKLLCEHLAIPFTKSMVNWPKLEDGCTGVQEWGELKNKELTDHWHANAIQSTHFEKPKSYDVDDQGNPTFREIIKLDDREVCQKAYMESLYYYTLLLAETDYLLLTD
jgi:hypothetical protein